ncbi:DUF4148 domain-containing protein [Ramlibacter tataouinensis]|uniref:DUF4148 domain-containing protein n=1 Tax=Ramlibacter tataouinensis TaxID=94132 RepID=UPI0022F3F3B4|nr:DUF4148 domain-containing protein [Ramlibacter tataouinensis]WBY03311.1 DUF4148 domain-containing protein [Ramlibacter tataouinensis]
MNRKIALALATFVAAGSAFADDITIDPTPFQSTATRAQVQAELAAYKKAGVNPWSTTYSPLRSFVSTKSRAEVVGEYIQARDRVAAMTREDSGSAYLARHGGQPAATRIAAR